MKSRLLIQIRMSPSRTLTSQVQSPNAWLVRGIAIADSIYADTGDERSDMHEQMIGHLQLVLRLWDPSSC